MDQWQGPHPGRRSRVGWTAVVGKINNRVSKLIFFMPWQAFMNCLVQIKYIFYLVNLIINLFVLCKRDVTGHMNRRALYILLVSCMLDWSTALNIVGIVLHPHAVLLFSIPIFPFHFISYFSPLSP